MNIYMIRIKKTSLRFQQPKRAHGSLEVWIHTSRDYYTGAWANCGFRTKIADATVFVSKKKAGAVMRNLLVSGAGKGDFEIVTFSDKAP